MTTCDPDNLEFPTSATGFREGTWVLSGCSVMRDGHTVVEEYGQDLDQLSEGDRVGVLRTAGGTLHLYVNGVDQGPAATGIPSRVWAVVDMYGKCAQVTVVEDGILQQGERQCRSSPLSASVLHCVSKKFPPLNSL